jgi:hypothetical protein
MNIVLLHGKISMESSGKTEAFCAPQKGFRCLWFPIGGFVKSTKPETTFNTVFTQLATNTKTFLDKLG